jgi:hypothetical protein
MFTVTEAVDSIWTELREQDAEDARYAEAFGQPADAVEVEPGLWDVAHGVDCEDGSHDWPWWNPIENKWEF